jgi:hypothetical protein
MQFNPLATAAIRGSPFEPIKPSTASGPMFAKIFYLPIRIKPDRVSRQAFPAPYDTGTISDLEIIRE